MPKFTGVFRIQNRQSTTLVFLVLTCVVYGVLAGAAFRMSIDRFPGDAIDASERVLVDLLQHTPSGCLRFNISQNLGLVVLLVAFSVGAFSALSCLGKHVVEMMLQVRRKSTAIFSERPLFSVNERGSVNFSEKNKFVFDAFLHCLQVLSGVKNDGPHTIVECSPKRYQAMLATAHPIVVPETRNRRGENSRKAWKPSFRCFKIQRKFLISAARNGPSGFNFLNTIFSGYVIWETYRFAYKSNNHSRTSRTVRMQLDLIRSIIAQTLALVVIYFIPCYVIFCVLLTRPTFMHRLTLSLHFVLYSYAPVSYCMIVVFVPRLRFEITERVRKLLNVCGLCKAKHTSGTVSFT